MGVGNSNRINTGRQAADIFGCGAIAPDPGIRRHTAQCRHIDCTIATAIAEDIGNNSLSHQRIRLGNAPCIAEFTTVGIGNGNGIITGCQLENILSGITVAPLEIVWRSSTAT